MKVLYLIDTLALGGTEVSLLEIVRHLPTANATVGHLYASSTGELAPRYRAAGAEVIFLDVPGRYALRQAVARIRRVVDETRPDVVHTSLFRAGLAGRVALRRSPVPLLDSLVNDSYSDERFRDLSLTGKLKLRAIHALDRGTARWVTHFVANSRAVRDASCRALGIAPERVTVIHRGRNLEELSAHCQGSRIDTRRRLGVPEDAFLVLCVSRLIPRKGHDVLIRALSHVRERAPAARLLLVGDGPARASLERRIAELRLADCIDLLGSRSDVPGLLAAADAFALPSLYEGCSGALIEAMLTGLPIVATDIPPNREVLGSEDTGILVPTRDSNALAESLLLLEGNRHRATSLGIAARRRARRHFDIRATARQHEELYDRISRDAD